MIRRVLFALLVLLSCVRVSDAAIAFDVQATPAFSTANVTTLSTAAFTIAGANRLLVVGVLSGAGTPVNPVSVKWPSSGGTALTQIGTTLVLGGNVRLSFWALKAPATGSGQVVVDWGTNQDETGIVAASYTGVDQTTTFRSSGTPNTATGTDTTPTVAVTSVSGDWVVDAVGFLDNGGSSLTLTVGASQTSHGEVEGANLAFEGLGTSHEVASGVSTTMSWTRSGGGSINWGIIGISLIPDAGGGGGGLFVNPISGRGGAAAQPIAQ